MLHWVGAVGEGWIRCDEGATLLTLGPSLLGRRLELLKRFIVASSGLYLTELESLLQWVQDVEEALHIAVHEEESRR